MADDKKIPVKRDDARTVVARQRAAAMAKAGPKLSSTSIRQYLKETWSELKKTTWPDRGTLFKSTMIVLAFIAATAVWNGGLDYILRNAEGKVFGAW